MENTEVTPEVTTEAPVEVVEQPSGDSPGKEESFAEFTARMKAQDSSNSDTKQPDLKEEEEDDHTEVSKSTKPVKEEQPKKESTTTTVKYKVDGEEFEVDIKDVPTLLSKAAGADRRFQEAANIRREAKEFVNLIKTDPLKAFEAVGMKEQIEEWAIDYALEQASITRMSPEERKVYEYENKIKQY
jgi:hypothetical protein